MIDSRTAHRRGPTLFGQVLSYDQWRSNASDLLEYHTGRSIECFSRAPWERWYKSKLWVSAAVHEAMRMYGLEREEGLDNWEVAG